MAHRGRVITRKAWLSIPAHTAEISSAGTNGGSQLAFASPSTILRIRGNCWAAMDATKQIGDLMTITWALGIVSTDAATLGSTALPDPSTEPEYPWLWWRQMHLWAQLASGNEAWGTSAQLLEIDSKAMRRVAPGQSLVWFTQTGSVTGAPVTRIVGDELRVLIGT